MNHIDIAMVVFTIDELVNKCDITPGHDRNQILHYVNVSKLILQDADNELKLSEIR
jgi:hypothetical protein